MDQPDIPSGTTDAHYLGLTQKLLARCTFPLPGTEVNVAVSGGADSMTLLLLAVSADLDVHAFHVDHGLREGSHTEAAVVNAAAQQLGAKFTALTVKVASGPNLEARARAARYSVLPKDVLTGHTADDQAETMLLNLMRGAAIDGMAGISPNRRPILNLRRSDTEALCEAAGINPVEDPTNVTGMFRRNRIRHEVLPLLGEIAERDVVEILARQAEVFREASAYLAEAAASLDPTNAKKLASAPTVLARVALRRWLIKEAQLEHPPSAAAIERVLAVARGQAKGTDLIAGWRVERSRQRLHLVRQEL